VLKGKDKREERERKQETNTYTRFPGNIIAVAALMPAYKKALDQPTLYRDRLAALTGRC